MRFRLPEKWIWLDAARYPKAQTSAFSGFDEGGEKNYTVAEFIREYSFPDKVISCILRVSADTEFILSLNGSVILAGPDGVGGDFLGNERARPSFYATQLCVSPGSSTLSFYSRVKLTPVRINEYSMGHGGFMLSAQLTFADGTSTVICTDKTWLARKNGAYTQPYRYDARIKADEYAPAMETQNIWHTQTSPLKPRTQELLAPCGGGVLELSGCEKKECVMEFDKIYAGFLTVSVKSQGTVKVSVDCFETDEKGFAEELVFDGDGAYRGLQLHSAGGFRIAAQSSSGLPARLEFGLISTHYPVAGCAMTVTDDNELNDVISTCLHTLKICRQTIHLDSPRHCEPLACTGDYYIESLMTAFSFGDMTLCAFDVRRTAELLRYNAGVMFHTTYSLIWVKMLYDVYMYTGDLSLLSDCADALTLLLERFKTYMGDNGLVETPPDFMFVDWIFIDGISLHHPPKALGQTCLNMFLFSALCTAEKIFACLGENAAAEKCAVGAAELKTAVNTLLFDSDRGLYFEGLNTPTPEKQLYNYLPQNVDKRYYRAHSNILAACFGICDDDTARALVRRVMADSSLGACQPYFKHFLLEAVFRTGLREEYTLQILNEWKAPVAQCKKGLVEGFIAPDESYSFDHSHAWGGTPAYALPKALLGFEPASAGLGEVILSPSLLGLREASAEIITPHGLLRCEMKQGKPPVLTVPPGINAQIV